MPLTEKDLGPHSSFSKQNEVTVWVGPFEAMGWKNSKIPLDGRKYQCGGEVIFKNGKILRASFRVDTTTFDFLEKESVYVNLNNLWYRWDEPELLAILNIKKEDAFPFTWAPDRPLDYHVKGPYPMNFFDKDNKFD